MADTADIERMLDAIAARQVTCPVCGDSTSIDLVEADWYAYSAHLPLSGGVIYGDDSDPFGQGPPAYTGVEIPKFLVCQTTSRHPDGKNYWWVLPDDIEAVYESDIYNLYLRNEEEEG